LLNGAAQELCRVLAELHDRAPVHGWEASRVAIEAAFGRPVGELFDEIEHAPLASGSIAQARRARVAAGLFTGQGALPARSHCQTDHGTARLTGDCALDCVHGAKPLQMLFGRP